MVDFRLGKHSLLDTTIVEILIDGKVVGVMYSKDPASVKLVSAHIGDQSVDDDFAGEVVIDDGSVSWPPIPAVIVHFRPSPYRIIGDRIVREE